MKFNSINDKFNYYLYLKKRILSKMIEIIFNYYLFDSFLIAIYEDESKYLI